VEKRWLLRLGPPVVALAALGALASVSLGAAGERWNPPDCRGSASEASAGGGAAAARVVRPAGPERLTREAWFALDPVLDATGTLAGQRLEIGLYGARSAVLDLAPESFAAGPFGRLVLLGEDDGSASVLRTLDRAADCVRTIAREVDIIRRATLSPDGGAVYEFRVARGTRADLGVWRRPIDGGPARRVVAPLAADRRFGRTFSTELSWSAEGDRLVVDSCGIESCRRRLVDPVGSTVTTVARPDLGPLVGVTRGRVISYAACPGLPCPLIAVDAGTGASVRIADAAGLARLVDTERGPRLVHEVSVGGRPALRTTGITGQDPEILPLPDPALHLVGTTDRTAAGTRLPLGWVVLTRDGRSPNGPGLVLIRLADGATTRLAEVVR